jgi:hypothetical protein
VIHFLRSIAHHPAPGVILVVLSAVSLFWWEALRLAPTYDRTGPIASRVPIVATVLTVLAILLIMIRFVVIGRLLQ